MVNQILHFKLYMLILFYFFFIIVVLLSPSFFLEMLGSSAKNRIVKIFPCLDPDPLLKTFPFMCIRVDLTLELSIVWRKQGLSYRRRAENALRKLRHLSDLVGGFYRLSSLEPHYAVFITFCVLCSVTPGESLIPTVHLSIF
jgi:hypothetical protein